MSALVVLVSWCCVLGACFASHPDDDRHDSGEEDAPDVPDGGQDAGGGVPTFIVRIEAESVMPTEPLTIEMDADASGGAFIHAPNEDAPINLVPTTGGRAIYRLAIPASGRCHVWFRVQSPGSPVGLEMANDSFWVSMGGSPYSRFNDLARGDTGWVWEENRDVDALMSEVLTYDLAAGLVDLIVVDREDGAQLDRIIVTNDASFTPTGLGD